MKTVMVIGATRNLGKAIGKAYSAQPSTTVYATARYVQPEFHGPNVHWISHIDITQESASGKIILNYNNPFPIDILVFAATSSSSMFEPEQLDNLDFEKELTMYKTSAIGPLFIIRSLVKEKLLHAGSKIIFIGNEAGSIALRTPGSKGEDFGHHGSQAALNMMTKLLSLKLAPQGIAVGVVHMSHPGAGHNLESLSTSLIAFIDEFNIEKTGQFWSPRGAE